VSELAAGAAGEIEMAIEAPASDAQVMSGQ
jgi:hypothetical protein